MTTKNYMTIREAAERLGIAEKTARQYVKQGKIRSLFMGGKYRIEPEDLEAFVRSRELGPKGRAASPTYSGAGGRGDYTDPYTAICEFVDSYVARWEERIASGNFDLGAFNEFAYTLNRDLAPVLRRLNDQEVRDVGEQPFSHGVPAALTGRALHQLIDLLDPLTEAMGEKLEEAEVGVSLLEAEKSRTEERREAG
jgi:excisionase family DNA binding protein